MHAYTLYENILLKKLDANFGKKFLPKLNQNFFAFIDIV